MFNLVIVALVVAAFALAAVYARLWRARSPPAADGETER